MSECVCGSDRSSHKRHSYSTHSAITINTSGVQLSKLPIALVVVFIVCAIPPTKHCQTPPVCLYVCAIRRKDQTLNVFALIVILRLLLLQLVKYCCYCCCGLVFMVVGCCYRNLRVSVSARCRRRCAYLQHII